MTEFFGWSIPLRCVFGLSTHLDTKCKGLRCEPMAYIFGSVAWMA